MPANRFIPAPLKLLTFGCPMTYNPRLAGKNTRYMNKTNDILRRWLRIDGLGTPENDIVLRFGLVFALLAVLIRFFFWAYTGRTWEDSLITVLHSENLMNGLGLTHYLGKGEPPLHGFTSPLSVLVPLIGDIFRVGFGLSFIKIVSALAGGLTVLYAMALSIHPKIKLPAPMAVMIMGYLAFEHHQILWGMAGMETQMATLVLLMSCYFAVAEKAVPLGISLGFCMLARPDFAFWTAIVGLYVLLFHPRKLATVTAIAIAVYMPWLLFTTWYYGSPLPNTIMAKELGYPLWTTWPQFSRTPSLVLARVWSSLTGSYGESSVFQPLGPSFAGHGTSYRAVFNDYGLICDFMIVMALAGTVSILRRRQWAYLPVVLFVLVYSVYYAFFVALVFSWYLSPFAAAVLFLSARGIQATACLVRGLKARTAAHTTLAALYLLCIVAVLPKTFATEKSIQETVENPVRKQIGLFLNRVMDTEETVGSESLGYIGYYSRRIVYDWPGLCSRKVVEFSRTHPREQRSLLKMLEFNKPDFMVLRHHEFRKVMGQPWFEDKYRAIASFEVPYDRNNPLFKSPNVDLGFLVFAKKTWHPGVTELNGEPIGINPKHGGALNLEGVRLYTLGREEEAVDRFSRAIAANPDIVEAHNDLGLILINRNKPNEALAEFRKVVEIDPDCAPAYSSIGTLLAMQGDAAGAAENLREALRCDPKCIEAVVNLANLLVNRGNLLEAKQILESALKIQPENAAARQTLKGINHALGR